MEPEKISDPSSRNCFGGTFLLANENYRNPIKESPGRGYNPSHLVKIAIESPQTLPEQELEQIVDV